MKDNIHLYHIRDDYVDYLRGFDNKVLFNKREGRPYVGVVLKVETADGEKHNYFVPLSSPKEKHEKMKNAKDFRKLDNGRKGALNFNNMLPVPDEQLKLINIGETQDKKYERLLRKQVNILRKMREELSKTAQTLYELRMSNFQSLSKHDKKIFQRCCDFPLLEQMAVQYQNTREAHQEVAATGEAGKPSIFS